MEEKKKPNYFLKVLMITFIIFISLYTLDNLGYYNIASKKSILTEEKRKEFESDVKNGNNIDIKKYIEDDTNYRNTFSNFGYKISDEIDKVLNKGLKNVGKVLEKLFK